MSIKDDAFLSKFSFYKSWHPKTEKKLNLQNLVIYFFEKYNLIEFTLEISFSVKNFLLHEVLVMQALKWKPLAYPYTGLSSVWLIMLAYL